MDLKTNPNAFVETSFKVQLFNSKEVITLAARFFFKVKFYLDLYVKRVQDDL